MCVLQLKIYTTLKLRGILEIFICYLKYLSAEPATKYQPPKPNYAPGRCGASCNTGVRELGAGNWRWQDSRPGSALTHMGCSLMVPLQEDQSRSGDGTQGHPQPRPPGSTIAMGQVPRSREQDQEGTMIGADTAAELLRQ